MHSRSSRTMLQHCTPGSRGSQIVKPCNTRLHLSGPVTSKQHGPQPNWAVMRHLVSRTHTDHLWNLLLKFEFFNSHAAKKYSWQVLPLVFFINSRLLSASKVRYRVEAEANIIICPNADRSQDFGFISMRSHSNGVKVNNSQILASELRSQPRRVRVFIRSQGWGRGHKFVVETTATSRQSSKSNI